jgi:hypothetical protein
MYINGENVELYPSISSRRDGLRGRNDDYIQQIPCAKEFPWLQVRVDRERLGRGVRANLALQAISRPTYSNSILAYRRPHKFPLASSYHERTVIQNSTSTFSNAFHAMPPMQRNHASATLRATRPSGSQHWPHGQQASSSLVLLVTILRRDNLK